jgi:hypothetical protein
MRDDLGGVVVWAWLRCFWPADGMLLDAAWRRECVQCCDFMTYPLRQSVVRHVVPASNGKRVSAGPATDRERRHGTGSRLPTAARAANTASSRSDQRASSNIDLQHPGANSAPVRFSSQRGTRRPRRGACLLAKMFQYPRIASQGCGLITSAVV